MLLKLLMKIWPSIVPISLYVLWVIIVEGIIIKKILKREKNIEEEGEYKVVGGKATKDRKNPKKISRFSLKNRQFVIIIYISLIFGILSLIYTAFFASEVKDGKYIPAKYEGGKVVPARVE